MTLKLALVGMGLLAGTVGQAAAVDLIPHRAVYDLQLAPGSSQMGEDATAMSGRMVFEFTGAACEGYTVNFRFVLEMLDGDDVSVVTDLRTSTFEGGEGDTFEFLSQTYTNQVLTEEVKGSAERTELGLEVELEKPEQRSLTFDAGVVLPTVQLAHIIEAAEAGETLLQRDVFDGSETGDKIYRTTTVIGPEKTGPVTGVETSIGDVRRWPVSIAYFSATEGGDLTPEYSISFDLWETGVSTDLTMDYGDFQLEGTLSNYETLPEVTCP